MLFALAAGGAAVASIVTVLAIHGAYRGVGFRAVSWIGGGVLGAILGFSALSIVGPRVPWPEWVSPQWLVPQLLGALIGALVGGTLGKFSRAIPNQVDEPQESEPVSRDRSDKGDA
jgi:hypothetical protein